MISGFVRLCFGALLNSLDGLRQGAFAQMKLSKFLYRFSVGFGVIDKHSSDHVAEAEQGLRSTADDQIITILQWKCQRIGSLAGDWDSLIRFWVILRVKIRFHQFHQYPSARARRQGPGVLSTAQESADI